MPQTEKRQPHPNQPNSLIGSTLGQFQLKEELGRGGMAVVYKGYQASLDRWVAIKTLPSEFTQDRELRSRFQREADAMVNLNHTNIVRILDRGEDQGHTYFAMEFVEGPSLKDLMKQEQVSIDLMFEIAQQVADGLAYAHKKGIVHRDIKPANILWESSTSLAKIADFGIARVTNKSDEMITLTQTNVGMGTMNYMAPEQKSDAGSVDGRADIYSLGVVVYEMFTGKLPMGRFKMPSELNPSLPRKLDELLGRCLETDPEDRWPSMDALKAELLLARQASKGGTLVRSVRDAAERTLTAVKGGGGGMLLVGCAMAFLVLGSAGAAGVWWFAIRDPGKTTATIDPKNTGTDPKDPKNTGTDPKDPKNTGTGTDPKDPKNTGTDPKDPKNTGTGTDPKDPKNTGTDPKDPQNTGTDPKDPQNTGTGTDPKDPQNTGTDPKDPQNTGTGTDPKDPKNTGTDPKEPETPPLGPEATKALQSARDLRQLLKSQVCARWAECAAVADEQARRLEEREKLCESRGDHIPLADAIRTAQAVVARELGEYGLRLAAQARLRVGVDSDGVGGVRAELSSTKLTMDMPADQRLAAVINLVANLERMVVKAARTCAEEAQSLARQRGGDLARADARWTAARDAYDAQDLARSIQSYDEAVTLYAQGTWGRLPTSARLLGSLPADPSLEQGRFYSSICAASDGRCAAVMTLKTDPVLVLIETDEAGKPRKLHRQDLPDGALFVAPAGIDPGSGRETFWVVSWVDRKLYKVGFKANGDPLEPEVKDLNLDSSEQALDLDTSPEGYLMVPTMRNTHVFFRGVRVAGGQIDLSKANLNPKAITRRVVALGESRFVIGGETGTANALGKDAADEAKCKFGLVLCKEGRPSVRQLISLGKDTPWACAATRWNDSLVVAEHVAGKGSFLTVDLSGQAPKVAAMKFTGAPLEFPLDVTVSGDKLYVIDKVGGGRAPSGTPSHVRARLCVFQLE